MGKKKKRPATKPSAESATKPSAKPSADTTDFLTVDTPIPGQSYACISFVSPDDIIVKKELFNVMHLLRDIFKRDEVVNDLRKKGDKLTYEQTKELYEQFVASNPQLTQLFDEENNFKTSVRGVKIRGVYSTQAEATARGKQLQQVDPLFHVYIGQVGYWLPWDPDPDAIEGQEYGDQGLNTLMQKYRENKAQKDQFFEQEKEQKRQDAIAKTLEQKKLLGNEQKAVDAAARPATVVADSATKISELRKIVQDKDNFIEANAATAMAADPSGLPSVNKGKEPAAATKTFDESIFDTDDPWLQAKLRQKK